ncbi:MAG: alanine racemase [Propionibacteriales bacterium]|nr:alanine racemase [Propionibacteriales bacterium]
MSLVLHVDGDRWRAHLRTVAEARPGLVPVAKGNGYGFGNGSLARRAQWLADQGAGCDTLAVGTYAELPDVAQRFDGDLLVLSPWRPWDDDGAASTSDERVVHTVGRLADLAALVEAPGRPRVVLERLTSMKRHGFTARGLREAAALAAGHPAGVRVEGVSLHLPLDTADNLAEAAELMTDVVAAGVPNSTVWVSHLDAAAVADLAAQYPDFSFRPRLGTELWLGDRGALSVTARVLDSHPVERGEQFGYRGRSVPRTGSLLVVSGGTAHGIGLESPTGEGSVRARAATLARGGLDALGLAKSPYSVAGKARYFAEPPHMQSSMLFLPSGVDVPATGDEVDVRVRFTTTTFDRVEID